MTSPPRCWPGLVAAGLILRARLFVTIGQRLPLLIAGVGSVAALLAALMTQFDGRTVLFGVAAPGLIAVIVACCSPAAAGGCPPL